MQSIDTHPLFIRQTVDRRQHEFVNDRGADRLAATARSGLVHLTDGGARPSQPRLLSELARRVRSALGAAA